MNISLLRSRWVKPVMMAVALYGTWVLMLLALQRSMIFPGAGSSPVPPNESALSAAGIERWSARLMPLLLITLLALVLYVLTLDGAMDGPMGQCRQPEDQQTEPHRK